MMKLLNFIALVVLAAAVTDITLENQMKIFMSRTSIIGEWLAYFDNSSRHVSELNKLQVKVANVNW